jgi:hypothetical protein
MRQFLPCKSLEETLSSLGINEQNLTTSESVIPVIPHPQERMALFEAKEKLKGGVGDGTKNSDFDANELAMGIEIEKEHTKDEKVAAEIARDHLSEIPDYYTRLKKMEKQANSEEEKPEDVQEEAKESKEQWKLQAISPSLEGVLNLIKTRMYQPDAELVPESDGIWKVKNGLSEFGLPFLPHWRVIRKKDRFRVEMRHITPEEENALKDAKQKWREHQSEHVFGFKDGKPIQKESTSWRLDDKPLHKKQHTNDINVIVVMMPDDEYSKKKQEASDIVLRKEAIELCSMDAEEIYGVFPNDEWDNAMKIAKGLIEEVDQARMERDNEDQEN